MRNGWSLKQLHRTILLSAAYRQAAGFNAQAAGIDAGNRLLWRKTPLRLEAEELRDAVLAISGQRDSHFSLRRIEPRRFV